MMVADGKDGTEKIQPHIAPWKKDWVGSLVKNMADNAVVGVVNIEGIPASQISKIRANLKNNSIFIVSKNSLLKLAFNEANKTKKGIDQLIDSIGGQCGVIMTDTNPFKLYQTLDDTKTKAPAKGGELASEDIVIEKGETPFKPGPIVGDLQKAGIPAAIDGGKIVIKSTKTMVKAGEPIPKTLAPMLTKLEIFPLTLGLDLCSAYEDGIVFGKDVLAVDIGEYVSNITYAATCSFNLAMYVDYMTSQTIMPMMQLAQMNSMNLALNANVVNSETAKIFMAKAHGQMLSLASRVPDALDDDLKSIVSSQPAQPKTEEAGDKKDDDKKDDGKDEEEEVSEEEAASGLGALFG
jgi:large subunit ribosomal protein L10